MKTIKVTESLALELGNTIPKFQDKIARLLNYSSAMGDYGDPCGELAVLSPYGGKVLIKESDIDLAAVEKEG